MAHDFFQKSVQQIVLCHCNGGSKIQVVYVVLLMAGVFVKNRDFLTYCEKDQVLSKLCLHSFLAISLLAWQQLVPQPILRFCFNSNQKYGGIDNLEGIRPYP